MKRLLLTLALLASSLLTAPASTRADAVTDWNAIMVATVATPPTNSPFQARWGAIVQVSVFEAVNSITGDYQPYLGAVPAPAWASPDAAAIAAAHRALVAIKPASAPTLDALRDNSLAAIPDGPAKVAGIAVGIAAADAILALRANDGWNVNVPYVPGTNPGDWQPAPPAFTPAAFTGWGLMTPFALLSGDQFRLPPPPGLQTGKYANDFNEVKLLGSLNSPFRPQDRTDVARFFAAASPTQAWNIPARQVSLAQGKSLSENARIFALLNMALCDGSIAAFDTKYHYNFWRPQMAIRGGDLDGNRQTDADPTWVPLITTPAFPSYASAHATLSAAAREVMERSFGKKGHAITLSNPNLGIVLNYSEWVQITDDISDARVYGGIHFRFDQEAGDHQGKLVGTFVLENYLLPLNE